MREFEKIEKVPAQLEQGLANRGLFSELRPWLTEFGKLGTRGKNALKLMEKFKHEAPEAFWNSYVQNIMSAEDKKAYDAHRSGTMPRKKKSELKDYAIITLAMLMGSLGLTVFLLPNHIGMGGITGISSIIYWGFNIPVEVTYLVINATLLAFALKILGWRFCVKTIYAALTFAMFVWLIRL